MACVKCGYCEHCGRNNQYQPYQYQPYQYQQWYSFPNGQQQAVQNGGLTPGMTGGLTQNQNQQNSCSAHTQEQINASLSR